MCATCCPGTLLLCCFILGRHYYPRLTYKRKIPEAPWGYMPIMKVVSGRSIIQIQFCLLPKPKHLLRYSTPNLTPSVGADGILVCHYLTKRRQRKHRRKLVFVCKLLANHAVWDNAFLNPFTILPAKCMWFTLGKKIRSFQSILPFSVMATKCIIAKPQKTMLKSHLLKWH